jgi:phosphate acetyltransferase
MAAAATSTRGALVAPRFSEIEVGTQLPPVVLQYSQDVIDRYALASLDMNPVHTNTEWSARAQVFGVPVTVGHGMMTMSSMASVVTRSWGSVSKNGGRVRFVDAKFTKPVKVDETVSVSAAVKKKHYHGAGKSWVTVAVEAKDTKGDTIGVAEVGYQLPD